MRKMLRIAALSPVLLLNAQVQTPGKAEFEVASIKANASQTGFHFAADAASGGPGTADPGMFRCTRCSLATLIVKAFNLQPYQFPGRTPLSTATYEIAAKLPPGATEAEFSAMLQNLLKDRFRLSWHFQEKPMKGYHLVVAKNGPKLTEATGAPVPPAADAHGPRQGEAHNHSGAIVFGTSATYRAAGRSTADLARVLSDQTGLPVDDATGLPGKYDIALRWSGTSPARVPGHSDNAFHGGSSGYPGHADGADAAGAAGADPSGPTLFDALQQQLGLKLVPADQAVARVFVVDHVSQHPAEN